MSFGEALRSELSQARRAVTRTFLRSFVVVGAALALWFNVLLLKDGVKSPLDAIVGVLVALGFAATYAASIALAAAAVSLGWHLFGAALIVPFLLTPVLLFLVFWLGGGFVRDLAGELLHALQASAQAAVDGSAFDALRVAHAGGPAALIILLIVLPFVIVKALPVLLGPMVLLSLLKLVACLAFLSLVAVVLTVAVSFPALGWSLVRRVRARQRA